MHVIATAGHVDHGKSMLVQALTGTNPDRLVEERKRGLSIELGFAWTRLRAGDVAFVDVPGHQRFLPTMLMGAGPVPAAMLVIAADDGWMPQTEEHLAALHAFGVQHAVVAINKCDVAAPGPVEEAVRALLSSTSLGGCDVVRVSARTGHGVAELRDRLDTLVARLPRSDVTADVRLWIDRAFQIRGHGLVVTGTLGAGTVSIGDQLELWDGDAVTPVRVRGLESMDQPAEQLQAVARIAINLAGAPDERPRRGSVLVSPGQWYATHQLDVRVAVSDIVPRQPILHLGGASTSVHARALGPTALRLSLPHALPIRVGDRGILRDPGTRNMWGIQVLDPMPPPISGRGMARSRAAALASLGGIPDVTADMRLRGIAQLSALKRIGLATEPTPAGMIRVGDWLISQAELDTLARRMRAELEKLSGETRHYPGIRRGSLARALRVESLDVLDAACRPPLAIEDGCVRLTLEGVELPGALAGAVAELTRTWDDRPFAAPSRPDLERLGLDVRNRQFLEHARLAVELGDEVLLPPNALAAGREILAGLAQPFTVSDARGAVDSNRRVVLALLHALEADGAAARDESGLWRCAPAEVIQ